MLRLSRPLSRALPSRRWPGRPELAARRFIGNAPPITRIEKLVLDTIKAVGPLSFSHYMQFCLSHPHDGYYMNSANAVFGAKGDFITSPEISQVFGELVGIWFTMQWRYAGEPSSIRLVELGPGRGTLMADILRVIRQFAATATVQHVHLVETSPTMRELQKTRLAGDWKLKWHDSIDEIDPSDDFTMLVAHEFFDALPINILERRPTGWHEVKIDAEPTEGAYPRLRRVLSPTPSALSSLLAKTSPRFDAIPEGAHLEVSQASFRIARKIGELIAPKGCALIADYGGAQPSENSFRAFKDHKIVDVFDEPGSCDLTANVDFGYLREAMQDLVTVHGPISQAEFLLKMGLEPRVKMLKEGTKSEERREAIEKGAKRLVDPVTMGREYKIMGVTTMGNDIPVYPFNAESVVREGREAEFSG